MKNTIISSVKSYSDAYFSEDINVVTKIDFDNCKCVKISLIGKKKFLVILRTTDDSLNKASEKLFGMVNEDMKIDLLKEMINTIVGKVQTILDKGYELSIPTLCNKCKIKNALYFKNSILEISISIQLDQK